MAERERIRLGNGVSLYREFETWSVEVSRGGKRCRWSLRTRKRGEARVSAGKVRHFNAAVAASYSAAP